MRRLAIGLVLLGSLWLSPFHAALCESGPVFFSGAGDLRQSALPGNGTPEDPYRLSGLDLDVGNRADYGICVENIQVSMVIAYCSIRNVGGDSSQGAIVLRNCRNVVVQDCTLTANRIAIALDRCTDVRIVDNAIVDNEWGIRLDLFSHGNVMVGNRFRNETNAIAAAPNIWTEEDRGNCWSDYESGSYQIGLENTDLSPTNLDACPAPRDIAPPVIHCAFSEPIVVDVTALSIGWSSGFYATDDREGHVSVECETPDSGQFTLGETIVRCLACDSSGNCSRLERQVLIVDGTPPYMRLLGPDPLEVEVGTDLLAVDPGCEAIDAYDGALTPIADYSNVDQDAIGEYLAEYSACDSSGNCSQASRRVVAADTTPPHLVLLGEDPLLLEIGADIAAMDSGVEAFDSFDGDVTGRVVSDYRAVDALHAGVYVIRYGVTDSSGNSAQPLFRTAVVGIGPVPVLPPTTPLSLRIDRWTIENGAVLLEMMLSDGESVSPYLQQLYIAQILHTIVDSLPVGIDLPLHFSIADALGSVLAGELLGPSTGESSDVTSAIAIARQFRILSTSSRELPTFNGAPQDAAEAHARAGAILAFLLESTSYTIRISSSFSPRPAYAADVSLYGMYPVQDIVSRAGFLIARVREDARDVAQAISMVLGQDPDVSVSQFVDVFGLIYRGSLVAAAPSGWVDVFVHPALTGT